MKPHPTLLLALLLGSAPVLAAEPAAEASEPTARSTTPEGESSSRQAAAEEEDWGIWNRTPRRSGRDPLLALGRQGRAPSPELIDAAARGEIISSTAGRENLDLNGWDSSRVASPLPKPDNGL